MFHHPYLLGSSDEGERLRPLPLHFDWKVRARGVDVIGGARILRERIEGRAERQDPARAEAVYPVEGNGVDHSPFVRRVRAHVEAAYGNAKLEALEGES